MVNERVAAAEMLPGRNVGSTRSLILTAVGKTIMRIPSSELESDIRSRRRRMAFLLLAGYILLIQAGETVARGQSALHVTTPPDGCMVYGTADPENLYSFTRYQIQALALAHAGELANTHLLTAVKALPPVQQVDKTINGLKEERKGNTCAAFVLADFAGSKDKTIAEVAKFLVLSYQQLGTMSNEMLGIVLQGAAWKGAKSSIPDQLAQWKAKRQKILDLMADDLKVSLSMLVDQRGSDAEGKTDHLILSHSQRNDLLDYLRSQFPALTHGGLGEASGDFTKQAALIQSFLGGKNETVEVKN